MFERFDEQARKVVVEAQEEAKRYWHGYIGTEHLLAGLIRETDGVGGQSLREFTSLNDVREQMTALGGFGVEEPAQAPFDPPGKKAMELALREALQLGDKHIGTEHLLLGLTRESGGNHAPILKALNVGVETVRTEVFKRMLCRNRTTAENPGDTNKRIAVALESIAKCLQRGWEMKTR